MKIIHYSDNHMNFGAAKAVHARAKEIGAKAVIMSGDAFDEQPSARRAIESIDRSVVALYAQAMQKIQNDLDLSAEEERAAQACSEKLIATIRDDAEKCYKTYDAISQEYGVQTLVVVGNHDLAQVMKARWTSAKFLNEQNVTIDGVKFGGMNHTYEVDPGLGQGIVDDPFSTKKIEQRRRSGVSESTLEAEIKSHPAWTRLVNEKVDVLVYHNPPHLGRLPKLENEQQECETGYLAEKIARTRKVPVLCGHVHGKPRIHVIDGVAGIRAGPNIFYEIDIDERTKKIRYVDVYRLVPIAQEQRRAA